MNENSFQKPDYPELASQIKAWARELGFADARISRAELPAEAARELDAWLAAGYHGEMEYMQRHGHKRVEPRQLLPGTLTIITARMNYWPGGARDARSVLEEGTSAYISRYALGRDYHKVLRARLQQLARRIAGAVGEFGHRVFTDSAPVAEVALAAQSGLGWRGKHTLLLTRDQGSLFFLGELFTDLPLPPDEATSGHCGQCRRCLDVCPTGAIVAPYQVDARRCISYLTIELDGSIPLEWRSLIGNRVYGCDDCQLHCPWNRFAVDTAEADFAVRNGLDRSRLVELFAWSEADFHERLAGSAIYRIGYGKWLRNLAVGLGNAPTSAEVVAALEARSEDPDAVVREHVAWALGRHALAVTAGARVR
ncbi:tRNA epoxyqueuosine(34) reductase QueG [Paludibacterium yongneupense]|uniref:tRNA epoxyqueuosine(34) reductase QueG n=1 Tax=Paludibacterium yongneupense TaxID=400061 RepID=UPI00041B8345|nr:tRNA epoxyqueuosine(34) reductase QueG [Paludibacterium yongneupense]